MSEPDLTTGPAPGPASSRRGLAVAAAFLGVLAVLLAAAIVVVLVWPTAVPGESRAEKANDRDLAVTVAATQVTKAFLDVDYRAMEPRLAKVLSLSTGTFKNQYETAKTDLKTQAQSAQAVAVGAVRDVGIADIDNDTAVVYVAADTTISNKSIAAAKAAGKTVDDKRHYRFQLNLTKVHGRWLLDDLQFIS